VMARLISRRFCPVLVISDGKIPESIPQGPFVRFADKATSSAAILSALSELINTGIPRAARVLHDQIDSVAGSYLWQFLSDHWEEIQKSGLASPEVLDRILRRRAAIQLSRLDLEADENVERGIVEGAEFYIYPPIGGSELRLGEVLRSKSDGSFRVVLTPHCHLAIQEGDTRPRSDFVLTVKALPAKDTIRNANAGRDPWKGEEPASLIRRRINCPADRMGRPSGRYWFLPGFLAIPDLYCDFMQVESIAYDVLVVGYERIAVLDAPFAEALQTSFTNIFSAVGIPGLDPARYNHLLE
jgi:hypothetical protein